MRIYDVKNKALEYKNESRGLLSVLFIVAALSCAFDIVQELVLALIGNNLVIVYIIGIIFSFVVLTIGHGGVVASLRTVRHLDSNTNPNIDGLVGVKEIKRLFPTYFIQYIVENIAVISFLIIAFITLALTSDLVELSKLLYTITNAAPSQTLTNYIVDTLAQIMPVGTALLLSILSIVASIASIYLICRLWAMPYILEKYGVTKMAALKESFRLTKGNAFVYFKLELSFIPRMFLCLLGISLIAMFLGSFLASIAGAFITIYFYQKDLHICKAIVYEELDYYDRQGAQ